MKQSIQLRLGQHLTMTPQLQQAIRLLQLSTIELNLEIQQALESNMMLELSEEGSEGAEEADRFLREGEAAGDGGSTTPGATTSQDAEQGFDTAEHHDSDDAPRATDIPAELPVDTAWEDIYDSGPALPSGGASASEDMEFESQRSATESLVDHLRWQLNLTPLSDTDEAIALAVIDAISSDGYLEAGMEELQEAAGPGVEPEEISAVIKRIQQFDPPGVCARDLRECLLLQLAQLPADTPRLADARRLVDEHLQLLASRDYTQLLRKMKLAREDLQKVVNLIQSLNPRPGSQFAAEETEYVVPDVFVRRKVGKWHVELNPEAVPSLRINRRYAGMIRRADNSPDNSSLRAHLQEARWFIKSLQSRGETLLKVATSIVERQRAFLEHGEEAMKPLVLHDIAEALGMHESTISRVTTRKYMHTPRGIYELKYFFSSHVSTAAGGEASSTAIRAVIRKLIDAENAMKPLSDSTIAQILSDQGINVARRTVAKYREAMNIPPSHERKRLT
ncbi:MAG: RNA polymerase sigma-54 factor [Gammaproteobacteria bacterium]|nr:RNA polymerase sigma-54 factor [Gammaproteobacteria bacterium]